MKEKPEFCWPEGIKRTKQRQRVMEALFDSNAPITAQELASRLEKQGCAIWLSTIYRILDTFTEKGVLIKTPVPDSGMAVYELQDNRHKHYAICIHCHRVIRFSNCPLESFQPQLAEEDFHILGHRLQLYGCCGRCQGQDLGAPPQTPPKG